MTWTSYIFPRRLLKTNSPYNADIRVLEEYGKPKLLVNGSRQSGEYVKGLWRKALLALGILPDPTIKKILIFGVAGGDIIYLLRDIFPTAEMTAVDIDKTMIEIGKQYFGLRSLQYVSFYVSDVRDFIKKNKITYDIVVLDTFNGWSVPDFVFDERFLKQLRTMVRSHGKLIINYIGEKEYKIKSDILFEKLETLFPMVQDVIIYLNRFFLASREG